MEGPVATPKLLLLFAFPLIALLLAGCGSPPPLYAPHYHGPTPTYYYVRPGETLYSIGQRFGVDHRKIARWSGVDDPGQLHLGQRLRLRPRRGNGSPVPAEGETAGRAKGEPAGADGAAESKESPQAGKVAVAADRERRDRSARSASPTGEPPGRWRWPVSGEVVTGFSSGGRSRNNGIDIAAPAGSEVRAAASGKVVYSGDGLRGYGNLVIIRHSGDYLTTYAYNRENLVGEDDRVEAGGLVARVGQTGTAEQPALHFDVRRRTEPINPLRVLPDR